MPERASRSKTISSRRRFARQLADAALGRMQAQLQALERAAGDDELAIEHEVVLGDLLDTSGDLGKVALERLLVFRLQVNAAAAPMREAAEAIVLRLILPPSARRQLVDGLGFHRR